MTTVALIVEAVLLAVLAVFVVALLRSHAEILRRLGALERGRDGASEVGRAPKAPVPADAAPDIVGRTLAGDAVKLVPGAGGGRTLLAFLSSGCAACGRLWSALAEGARVPAGARLILVAKGTEQESLARLQELAPGAHELFMSTQAWTDYAVPGTPHFVLVDGEGMIEGRGSASSWEQLVALVEQSSADAEAARTSGQSSAERAARAEQALARAGITPGHPSLYPSRGGEGG
jgi:hypothetical protein